MGQQCSWPCAYRKIQKRRLIQSKYNFSFLEDSSTVTTEKEEPKKKLRLESVHVVEELIQTQEAEASKSQLLSTPRPQTNHTATHSIFSFTSDSVRLDGDVIVVCEAIDDFNAFMDKYMKKYNKVRRMEIAPTFVTPHPFHKKAIVVFETVKNVQGPAVYPQQLRQNQKIIEFEKDLRHMDNKASYQILTQFIKEWHAQGYQFIGYYFDTKFNYHFVFCEKESFEESSYLDFQTLENLSQDDLEVILNEPIENTSKIIGAITLLPTKPSPKHFCFAIFEHKKNIPQHYITVDIAGEALEQDGVSADFSKKIELGCQLDVRLLNLDLATIITNHEDGIFYLVFSKH